MVTTKKPRFKKKLISTWVQLILICLICSPLKADLNNLAEIFQAYDLDDQVLQMGLNAHANVKDSLNVFHKYLTIIDFTQPSTKKRMWLIDMHTGEIVHHTLVAHGINSGANYATRFSNNPGSLQSSIGVYVTLDVYHGKWGRSLNLHGLEEGINSNALTRRIVVHQASYVDPKVILKKGRLGRSWGCFTLNAPIGEDVISMMSMGSVIFAYYPDNNWLATSKFINK